ncbi:MAG: DHH family phosphoesterase [Gammaproteobacteria bacterium]|nr:DHH family phosphoesterase [Gammaproteobacteria bacterium]
MTHFDVFNGDADGICALIQLRLNEPKESQLVTAVKRDTALLKKLSITTGDSITVLDISLDKNQTEVNDALKAGATVFYVDHHLAKSIPEAPGLKTIIDTNADICTSILINQYLNDKYIEWAIVGTFGDNLKNSARNLCNKTSLRETEIKILEQLGIYINYNGYGSSLDDLHFTPSDLYLRLCPYENPLLFHKEARQDFDKLASGYETDMASAKAIPVEYSSEKVAVFILPNEAWARRASGVYGNYLANQSPERAHGVLTLKENGAYLVSIRAPLNNKAGAAEFCKQFPTGGGRAAAAGINNLPANQLTFFIDQFNDFY